MIGLLLALVLSSHAEAAGTAAGFLRKPILARPVGLGGAFTAMPGSLDSLFHNPAGLSGVGRPELASSYARGLADVDLGFIGYAQRVSSAALAGAFLYHDAGDIQLRFTGGADETRKAGQDIALIAAASVPIAPALHAGAAAKLIRSELAEEASAAGYGFDVGAIWSAPLRGLRLAASVQNLGPDLRFEQEDEPLPLSYRFGASYHFGPGAEFPAPGRTWRALLTGDLVKIRSERPWGAAGVELQNALSPSRLILMRLGVGLGRDDFLALGFGVHGARLRFDYGYGLTRVDDNTHHVTIGLFF